MWKKTIEREARSAFGPRLVEELEHLRQLIEVQQELNLMTYHPYYPEMEGRATTKTALRRQHKYVYIDIGSSGRYMVDNQTGQIFGIKAYGVVNRRKQFGTVHTVDEWNWGEYWARPRPRQEV